MEHLAKFQLDKKGKQNKWDKFDVLLTVHLSIISVINQLIAQILV